MGDHVHGVPGIYKVPYLERDRYYEYLQQGCALILKAHARSASLQCPRLRIGRSSCNMQHAGCVLEPSLAQRP